MQNHLPEKLKNRPNILAIWLIGVLLAAYSITLLF